MRRGGLRRYFRAAERLADVAVDLRYTKLQRFSDAQRAARGLRPAARWGTKRIGSTCRVV
jgi:hypothetical protein